MTDQLRIFAGLQGFVSAAGLLALVLFTPMILVGFIWLWPAAAAAVGAAALPSWVLPLSIGILLAFVVGGAVIGGAFLLPADSAMRTMLLVGGGIPIALAMIAFPAWWVILASNVR